MVRTLGRIASLLLVTGLVAGALYYLVTANQGRGSWPGNDAGNRRAAARASGDANADGRTLPGTGAPSASPDATTRPDARTGDGTEPVAREGRGRRGWGRERPRTEDAGRGGEAGPFGGRGERRGEGFDAREGREGHGGHGEFSPGRGAAGLLITTLQVAFVAALVVGLQRWFQRKRQAPPPTSQPA
jgi:hypothetical protein